MKKYIATIESRDTEASFKVLLEDGILWADNGEEIYDIGNVEASDKEIVETVYDLYNGNEWCIDDCIEFED